MTIESSNFKLSRFAKCVLLRTRRRYINTNSKLYGTLQDIGRRAANCCNNNAVYSFCIRLPVCLICGTFRCRLLIDVKNYSRVVTWYMGSGLKAQNIAGIRAQRKGLRLRRMGSGITRLLSPNQGSDLLHGLKISYHNIFPHNKVCVHRISWPRYITYSCFWLAAIPAIRCPGCLTKSWLFVTQLHNALSAPEGRESDLYVSFFCEKWERRKRTKRNPVTEKGTYDLLPARVQA